MNLSSQFSKDLKIQKSNFLFDQPIDRTLIELHLAMLADFDFKSLRQENEKKAFWINVYNGLTNYLIITLEIKKNMREVEDVFKRQVLEIGGLLFSLDDIEHGILRQKEKNVLEGQPQKVHLQLENLDYRIHFALNCGAGSCPMIAFYTPENIDEELSEAEAIFVESAFLVDDKSQKITCSSLFDWYKADFEGRYLTASEYKGYKVELTPYDWSL